MARPGAFKPGQSGNPGGRPKALRDVEAAARQYTAAAIETLARICGDQTQPAAARVTAANALLDRAWGKATDRRQDLDADGNPADPRPTFVLTVER
jgi:Family of unknown function (DUF5681)